MPKIEEINKQNQDDIIKIEKSEESEGEITENKEKDWKGIHPDFTEELQKEWEERGFTYEETKEWIKIGLWPENYESTRGWKDRGFSPNSKWVKLDFRHDEYNVADFLRWKGYQPEQASNNLDELRKECDNEGFAEAQSGIVGGRIIKTYQQLWEKNGFTYQDAQQWIKAGFKPNDIIWDVVQWKEMDIDTQQVQEWTQVGFKPNDYLEIKKWKDQGLDLEAIKQWIGIGFKIDEAERVEEWKNQGFALEEVQQWLDKGLNKGNTHFAKFLLDNSYTPSSFSFDDNSQLNEMKGEYLKNNNDWTIIHEDYAKKDYQGKTNQQYWEEVGLTYSEAQQWIQIGFEPSDYKEIRAWKNYNFTPQQIKSWRDIGLDGKDYAFAAYLKSKNRQPGSDLNLEQLREEFNDWLKDSKSAQEWLDSFYPTPEAKDNCKEIKIGINEYHTGINTKLKDSLKVENFKNLNTLSFPYSKVTSLHVSNCPNLVEINCGYNKLKELKITNCPKLTKLDFWGCGLKEFDFSSLNPESLVHLQIGDNNLSPQDVSCLAPFVNLEWARIGTMTWQNQEFEEAEDVRNRFYGSLKAFKDMKKLRDLNIANTDIDSGLEYLPKSLERGWFECHSDNDEFKVSKVAEEWERFKEDRDSANTQEWLDKTYPEKERKRLRGSLDISERKLKDQELKGRMKLEGFTNLKKLICSNQLLTYLFLDDCKNLVKLQCNNNKFPNLDFLGSANLTNLKELDISGCPTEGNLKSLANMSNLEVLNISNTQITEGLEYLPESCKKLYCNSDYLHKSIEIVKELEKYGKCSEGEGDNKYYDLDKWKANKQNNMISDIIPLERLFVIRGNLKNFVSRWGIKEGNKLSELSKLQDPKETSTYLYVGEGGQWLARGTAVTGGILAATVNPVLGGVLAAVSPVVEVGASQIKEKIYETNEKKWNDFLEDADTFLDNFHELLGILAPIEIKELREGKVSQAVKKLNEKTEEFLKIYDEDKNKEISLDELIKERCRLAKDLNKGEKESETWGIVEAVKNLEKEIIEYRKLSHYGAGKEEVEESEPKSEDENKLSALKIKLAQKKKEREQLEQRKNELAVRLKELEINYQKSKKELSENQNNSLLFKKDDEELKLLNQEIEKLKKELIEAEQEKEETKKELIEAKVALFKYQIQNLNLGSRVRQGWEKTCEFLGDWITNFQIKMNTPVYYWKVCCETKKDKGKARANASEQVNNNQNEQGESSYQAQQLQEPK